MIETADRTPFCERMSGSRSNVAASISTPVESSRPVVGHLTMTTLVFIIINQSSAVSLLQAPILLLGDEGGDGGLSFDHRNVGSYRGLNRCRLAKKGRAR